MSNNKELERRIETLEKEVQHLKAILQYQMRNKKKWFIKAVRAYFEVVSFLLNAGFSCLIFKLNIKRLGIFSFLVN